MKKFLLIGFIVLATNAYAAKRVTICHIAEPLADINVSVQLACSGDFDDMTNIVELYKKAGR